VPADRFFGTASENPEEPGGFGWRKNAAELARNGVPKEPF